MKLLFLIVFFIPITRGLRLINSDITKAELQSTGSGRDCTDTTPKADGGFWTPLPGTPPPGTLCCRVGHNSVDCPATDAAGHELGCYPITASEAYQWCVRMWSTGTVAGCNAEGRACESWRRCNGDGSCTVWKPGGYGCAEPLEVKDRTRHFQCKTCESTHELTADQLCTVKPCAVLESGTQNLKSHLCTSDRRRRRKGNNIGSTAWWKALWHQWRMNGLGRVLPTINDN